MPTFRDLQFALRALARAPGFTVVVLLTLALGIGASTAIFSVVEAVVLRPLDYPDPARLARITSELGGFGATDTGVAPAELIDYRERTDLFAGVAGFLPVSANVTSGGVPERVEVLLVGWTYFDVLGVRPEYGRAFVEKDDVATVANIAVVSDGFWRRRLGADPGAVGRTIVVDDDPVLVVGVMPPGFQHPGRVLRGDVDIWSPAGFRSPGAQPPSRSRRRLEGCLVRLQPGVTLEQAQSRLADYGLDATRRFPSDYPAQDGWRPRIVPLQEDLVGGVATPMYVLLAGVGLLLLVACVNVAHLVLARASSRRQEMAIRVALGASGARLARQLVTESALLAAGGCTLGVLVASWSVRGLIALAPERVPRLLDATLDFRALAAGGVLALAVSIAFAAGPLLRLRESAVRDDAIGGGSRQSAGRSGARARGLLVAAQVAIATVLLVGAGLFVRTVFGLLRVPVGFETARLVTARLTLPRPNEPSRAHYLDAARRVAFASRTLQQIEAVPGVERAAIASQVPLGGFNPPLLVEIEGRDSTRGVASPVMHDFQVSSGYLDTMGIPLVRGRGFAASDRAGAAPVAMISDAAAKTLWRGRDPIGQRLRLSQDSPWMTIVGVAGDVVNRRLTEPPQAILYRPFDQASDLSFALLIRTRGDAPGLGAAVARAVTAVDPDVPVYSVRTMSELLGAAVAQRRFLMRLLVAFGAAATGLALLGIYGVMAFAVAQRTREIGIRMAIGAQQGEVAMMVLRRGLLLTAGGVAAGLAASIALSRLARSQLFGVTPSDPATLIAVVALMLLAAGAAAYGPARRAARVDPVRALRAQ